MNMNWQPSATVDALRKRADILRTLRDFFYQRHITEVETPLLCVAGTTDAYLDSITATINHEIRYLQTSPEYAMKRLLAAKIGDCYQICKAFRCDESGRYHNPEFTMLEWYRLNFDHHQLMNDMDELLQTILKCLPATRISYQQLFLEHLNIDPHQTSIHDLKSIAPELCAALNAETDTKDDYLMLLLSHLIEPKIGFDRPCFIYDYPASQAALSKIQNNVAERFEVYVNGIELANGFHELQSADEQRKRFLHDNEKRKQLKKLEVPIDQRLLDALQHGLPACAGVALGVDRLIMLALQKNNLQEVLSFNINSV